jgi:hypothetical protein
MNKLSGMRGWKYVEPGLTAFGFVTIAALSACSTSQNRPTYGEGNGRQQPGQAAQAAGPAIINPRAATPVLVANADLDKAKTPNVLAEVKPSSPRGEVSDVKLRLVLDPSSLHDFSYTERSLQRPIDISMQHVAGTTWGANIDDKQMKKLAINGEDLTYIGRIIAQTDNGGVSVSDDIVKLEVKAPTAVEKSG